MFDFLKLKRALPCDRFDQRVKFISDECALHQFGNGVISCYYTKSIFKFQGCASTIGGRGTKATFCHIGDLEVVTHAILKWKVLFASFL